MTSLILLRHGQSQWNLENRFTGWVDVDLSDQGRAEAAKAGLLIADAGIRIDRCHTSVLKRAIRTLWIALDHMDRMWLPQQTAWELNERHYGGLTGLDKAETAAQHGDEQVHIWRRSYDIPPPPLDRASEYHPIRDPRYAGIDPAKLPDTESLKTTLDRVMPYWRAALEPALQAGQNLLIAAHGNSLRALVKHLFAVSDDAITGVEIPTGNPLLIDLDDALTVTATRYLDAERATTLPSQ